MERRDKERKAKAAKWLRWKRNPTLFIDECIWTRDEADAGQVKKFPQKEYLHRIDQLFISEPILAIPKSRRMMMTWRLLALVLWEALFHRNMTIFIQSKKAADSAYLMGDDRIMFMYGKLPAMGLGFWPKVERKIKDNDGKGYETVQLSNGTSFFAVAEGPDQLRQYTASRVYCTEMAFWGTAELTWTALRPTIQGGGKIVIDSSANPGFFQRLIEGTL